MTSVENKTLKNGNPIHNMGRMNGSRNRAQIELQRIGEENAKQILEMHIETAKQGDKDAQQFLINKFLPNAKGGRLIEVDLPETDTAENVKTAFGIILQKISKGEISPDEGEKLCTVAEYQRKAIEMTDIDKRLRVIEENIQKISN